MGVTTKELQGRKLYNKDIIEKNFPETFEGSWNLHVKRPSEGTSLKKEYQTKKKKHNLRHILAKF